MVFVHHFLISMPAFAAFPVLTVCMNASFTYKFFLDFFCSQVFIL